MSTMLSTSLPLARLALNLGVNVSVSKVVYDVIRNNVSVLTPADKIKVWSGTLILGSMIADHATKHINDYVDQAIVWNENRKMGLSAVES